ncbi:uncharacterized protein [Palaemon carinicauda]|uniref:uncharacterized protein n=1 Tax=Palaemon carinicauda TaxID=392227 RepID=UPI0035B629E7
MIVLISSLLILGLCAPALSQLGEINPSVATVQPSAATTTSYYYDEVIFDDDESPDIVLNKDVGERKTRSRTVEETYQGCLSEKYIYNGTYIYFNLTEELKDQFGVSNEADWCYYLCLHQDPFSFFISVNKGLGGSHDACGCHAQSEIDILNIDYYDSSCDKNATLAKIYCGPENIGCINGASFLGSSTGILCLILSSLAVWSGDLR